MKYEVRFTTQFKNENLKHSSFIKRAVFFCFYSKKYEDYWDAFQQKLEKSWQNVKCPIAN